MVGLYHLEDISLLTVVQIPVSLAKHLISIACQILLAIKATFHRKLYYFFWVDRKYCIRSAVFGAGSYRMNC